MKKGHNYLLLLYLLYSSTFFKKIEEKIEMYNNLIANMGYIME